MVKHYYNLGKSEPEQPQSGLAVGSVRTGGKYEKQQGETVRLAKEQTVAAVDAARREVELARVALAPSADSVFVVPPEERRMVGSEVIGRQVELNIGRTVVAPIYLLDKYAE